MCANPHTILNLPYQKNSPRKLSGILLSPLARAHLLFFNMSWGQLLLPIGDYSTSVLLFFACCFLFNRVKVCKRSKILIYNSHFLLGQGKRTAKEELTLSNRGGSFFRYYFSLNAFASFLLRVPKRFGEAVHPNCNFLYCFTSNW